MNMLSPPSGKFLIGLVALKHGVEVSDILSPDRSRKICAARHEAIAVVYVHTGLSMARIGALMGGRDHSTISSALHKHGIPTRLKPLKVDREYYHPGKGRPPDGKAPLIRASYAAGKPVLQIAAELGISKASVLSRASKMGLKHPSPTRGNGCRAAINKVPPELHDDFRVIRSKKFTVRETLRILGVAA